MNWYVRSARKYHWSNDGVHQIWHTARQWSKHQIFKSPTIFLFPSRNTTAIFLHYRTSAGRIFIDLLFLSMRWGFIVFFCGGWGAMLYLPLNFVDLLLTLCFKLFLCQIARAGPAVCKKRAS